MNPRQIALVMLLALSLSTGWLSPVLMAAGPPTRRPHTVAIGRKDLLVDGRPLQIRCGEMHAPRVPKEYWHHRLKMLRAMGLNAVCAYLFWNLHEPAPGRFVWEGPADAAGFCRAAQEEGLWVLLRPGPYACAEWEMGGLPWWLLKHDDIKLRSRDPRFLNAAQSYLKEVGRTLAPLQATRGGPILMVQVENEYGSYGNDAAYMGALRSTLVEAGFDVPLFSCNPPGDLRHGYRDDLLPVVNFGSDPAGGFRALRAVRADGPLICGEFYPGWFDTWGSPHHLGKPERYLNDLKFMLDAGASFSIYMAHGGTTFGLWSGADRPFQPDTSSYDYDAPISEAGWPTDKFARTRELMSHHLQPGETLPDPPARNPVIAVAAVTASERAALLENLPEPVHDARPRTMEHYDQGYGVILYRTTLPPGPAAALEAVAVHDLGIVLLDGRKIGVMDRRTRSFRLRLPARNTPAVLGLLVEAMGRVNFGPEVHDRKGLHGPVRLGGKELSGWKVNRFPLDAGPPASLHFRPSGPDPAGAAFWRAVLDVPEPGDTFLDMAPWGKGVAWVNGHCLGRFWNIGPTQTMYVPGPWLRPGRNEVVIFDLIGPQQPVVRGLKEPVLDRLRPELDPSHKGPTAPDRAVVGAMVQEGQFAPGTDVQIVRFVRPAKGRYVALQSLSAHDGKPYAAVAELSLLGPDGQPVDQGNWTVAGVDSEELSREDGSAGNALDGQAATFWHTQWGDASPGHPHRLVIDLGASRSIGGLRYVPRPGAGAVGGRIKDYRIIVGDRLISR